MMRTLLLGPLVAVMLSGCGSVPPSPAAVTTASPPPTTPATPSPSQAASPSAPPSPIPSTPYALDCGPLAGTPDDCAAAVDAGLRLLSLVPGDVSAVRVEPPGPACSPSGLMCRRPTVVVRVFKGAVAAGEMPLVRTGTGWIGLFQIR